MYHRSNAWTRLKRKNGEYRLNMASEVSTVETDDSEKQKWEGYAERIVERYQPYGFRANVTSSAEFVRPKCKCQSSDSSFRSSQYL